MQNKISINADFIKKIISSKLKDEVAIKREDLPIPGFMTFIIPEILLKLDKQNIEIGNNEIVIPLKGMLTLKIKLFDFQISQNNIEFYYSILINFLGEHRADKIINLFFKEIDDEMFHKSGNKIIVKSEKIFSENEIEMQLKEITVNDGIEICWE